MNITEFAAYAGVSKAAVSRYFNGGYLSEEKRARIEAAGCGPPVTGPASRPKCCAPGRTRQVLVILPKLSSESCARMVEGISAILEESGYQLLLVNTANDSSKEIAALHLLQQNTVDGVILIATIFTPEHRTILSSLRLPVVILARSTRDSARCPTMTGGRPGPRRTPTARSCTSSPRWAGSTTPTACARWGTPTMCSTNMGLSTRPAGSSTGARHQHRPAALAAPAGDALPDQPFDCHGNYSGSALCEDGQLWLFYTGNVKLPGRYDYIHEGREHNLCLAVSRDCLTADTKECLMRNADYPEGLSCHVRDPKVWRQDGVYYMVLGARTREDGGECWCCPAATSAAGGTSTPSPRPNPLAICGSAPTCSSWTDSGFYWCRPRASPARMCTAAAFLPCTGISGGECTLGDYHPLDGGFDYYAPQSFADGGTAAAVRLEGAAGTVWPLAL